MPMFISAYQWPPYSSELKQQNCSLIAGPGTLTKIIFRLFNVILFKVMYGTQNSQAECQFELPT